MTAQMPEDHIVDLLPAYLNGQLDASSTDAVRLHLASCTSCRQELEELDAIKGAAKQVFAEAPLPSTPLMSRVWAQIDAEEAVQTTQLAGPVIETSPHNVTSHIRHVWQVFRAQVPLLPRSIWVASALVCLFALTQTIVMAHHAVHAKNTVAGILILFHVIVGAAGSAFIFGARIDPGFELTISTPTSVRLVMLCRLVIVLGYNILLALLSSAVFATLYGGSLWGFVQLWLGSMFLLSSLCLALSLLVSSSFALLSVAALEVLQTFPRMFNSGTLNLALPVFNPTPTSPIQLIAALLLFAFAVFWIPRQPRLTT